MVHDIVLNVFDRDANVGVVKGTSSRLMHVALAVLRIIMHNARRGASHRPSVRHNTENALHKNQRR